MIVVADASPLIFLGKIRQLHLIRELLGDDVRVPQAVCSELLVPGLDPVEEEALRCFLRHCRIEEVVNPVRYARAMSRADNEALTLAVRCRADVMLCDERVTRLMAASEGIRPLGTLGVLLRAVQAGILPPDRAKELVDELVRSHALRIGIRLYQSVWRMLEARG